MAIQTHFLDEGSLARLGMKTHLGKIFEDMWLTFLLVAVEPLYVSAFMGSSAFDCAFL